MAALRAYPDLPDPLLGFDVSTLSPTGPDADGITRVMTAIAGSEKSEWLKARTEMEQRGRSAHRDIGPAVPLA